MTKSYLLLFACMFIFGCKPDSEKETIHAEPAVVWERTDETAELEEQAQHEMERMRFELINTRFADKNDIWEPFEADLAGFSEEKYEALKPLILENNIPQLQQAIKEGKFSYTDLTLFYIYRIRKYESDNHLSLNSVIALNPDVLEQAWGLDNKPSENVDPNSVYGMPLFLKDNINTSNMPTTAGAIALAENTPSKNAFIVDRLLEHNALILGKVNLSEWAYYFCEGCPLGYSAIGGQTLNPYGRKKFESGGSSSGSGVVVAANFAVAAVGTETSGSILSPASMNSVVGLKPTVGLLSRSGIVPISSTLDTPGPMTKTVIDNAILLNAMVGKDSQDEASVEAGKNYIEGLKNASLKGKRVGVMVNFLSDSIYSRAVEKIKEQGAIVVEFEPTQVPLPGFLTLLDADMKKDIPRYLATEAGEDVGLRDVNDIVAFNQQDTSLRAPYGQGILEGIVADSTSPESLEAIKNKLQENGRQFFDVPMREHNLDVVLSINNQHAAYAAVAKYPAIAVPMGYRASGEPRSATFIAKPFEEAKLLEMAAAFEAATKARIAPANYN